MKNYRTTYSWRKKLVRLPVEQVAGAPGGLINRQHSYHWILTVSAIQPAILVLLLNKSTLIDSTITQFLNQRAPIIAPSLKDLNSKKKQKHYLEYIHTTFLELNKYKRGLDTSMQKSLSNMLLKNFLLNQFFSKFNLMKVLLFTICNLIIVSLKIAAFIRTILGLLKFMPTDNRFVVAIYRSVQNEIVHFTGGVCMDNRTFIGIDPDSKGFEAALLKPGAPKTIFKHFSNSTEGLYRFINFILKEKMFVLAIEGINGYSGSIEGALRENKVIFHSFSAYTVAYYRNAICGQNKNNPIDAEMTARLAKSLDSEGLLHQYQRVFFPDPELQTATRLHMKRTAKKTSEVNQLWKIIGKTAPDLFLFLHSKEESNAPIQTVGFLTLLKNVPDIGSWKNLDEQTLFDNMNVPNRKCTRELVASIKSIAYKFKKTSELYKLALQSTADQILRLKHNLKEIEKAIKKYVKNDPVVSEFLKMKGIAIMTAAKLRSEIIDIRRFANNDKLAAYAGLCRKEYSTGNSHRDKSTKQFNHWLKNAMITAATNFMGKNPDSHLTGYWRNLKLKRHMKPIKEQQEHFSGVFIKSGKPF